MKKHFLDNIILELNCIFKVAAMENAVQSQKLLKLLIDNLRYKIGREGQIVKIKEELVTLENMLQLYKIRFGDILTYQIDINPSCLELYIPHYMLMTFVKNCLYHAFGNKEGTWNVGVSIDKIENNLEIIIEDNGIGFDADKYLYQGNSECEYGTIPSTIYRINEYCGIENAVKIESSQEKGTSVYIRIPLAN